MIILMIITISVPGPPNATTNNNDFFMLFLITMIGMILYALRPNSLRQPEAGKSINDDVSF